MHDIIKDFGPEYDKLWIFSKIHHEMNQLCSKSTLQEIYVDKFDQVEQPCASLCIVCKNDACDFLAHQHLQADVEILCGTGADR